MVGLIVIPAIFISSAILLWFIANKRGANTLFWSFMGAFFGPLAIPFVFFTKNNSSEAKQLDKFLSGNYPHI